MPGAIPIGDEIGKRYGRLTVIVEADRCGDTRYAKCVCDCGTTRTIRISSLRNGTTRSCGCLHRELLATRNRTHGRRFTPEYNVWHGMIRRCCTPTNKHFKDYGDRGITVCDRWMKSFENFINDMGARPSPSHTLDRIDNNGQYEPSNCRWSTHRVQTRNKRNNRYLEFDGKNMPICDWAESVGIHRRTLTSRLSLGWSVVRALTEPVRGKK